MTHKTFKEFYQNFCETGSTFYNTDKISDLCCKYVMKDYEWLKMYTLKS